MKFKSLAGRMMMERVANRQLARLALQAVVSLALTACALAADRLERGFENPPPEYRPEVLWDWMGGLISREGITKDLEALKAQGLGGAVIMQMPDQCPYPRQWSFRDYPGKVTCLSDEWFALMNFAVGEADRLGLKLGIFICPGWSHAGGPWVTPEKGLKKLAFTRLPVSGPTNLHTTLVHPPVSPGQGGGNQLPAWSKDTARLPTPKENFYRDVAVLAVPEEGPNGIIEAERIQDISSHVDSHGVIQWRVPEGRWTIWRVALQSENGLNHPAPIDGIGLECDRMDPAAVQQVFDGMVGRISREAKAKGYKAFTRFETDSYEAGYQDFGVDYRAQFRKRRGYDCVPWLPGWLDPKTIVGSSQLTQRFHNDMVRTITELWAERFHRTLRRLADKHGMDWMVEPYWGAKLDWRTIAGLSTMPGSEFWVGLDHLGGASPETSALYGQKIVWAEAFTAESYRSAWRNDPWTLKLYGDRAFCRGVNMFFMHGFVHNPFPDEYQPGLTMGYWGTQLSRHVTWWSLSKPWHNYLTRCQYLLQQGVPASDVLLYPPAIAPVVRRLDGLYRQTTLTDDVLLHHLAVRGNRLVLPHGTEFAALALNPDLPLRPEALKKLRDLVRHGATLIGNPPPAWSSSLENFPKCDTEVAQLVQSLWGGAEATTAPAERRVGRGRIISGLDLTNALNRVLGQPDFVALRLDGLPAAVRSEHRREGTTEFWFLSNQAEEALSFVASLHIAGKQPEWWNPQDGSRRSLPGYRFENGRTILPLHLATRESGFLVFRCATQAPGRLARNYIPPFPRLTIPGPWRIQFDLRWGGPVETEFSALQDWSTNSDRGIKYYSGTARYSATFDASPALATTEGELFLRLGVVRNLARVRLNSTELGIIWCAPWQIPVPNSLLRPTGNLLEIEVVNTWVNRLIGDEQEPEDCDLEPGNETGDRKGSYDINITSRGLKDLPDWLLDRQPRPSKGRLTFTSWRFYDQSAPLASSGLLGPVELLTSEPHRR